MYVTRRVNDCNFSQLEMYRVRKLLEPYFNTTLKQKQQYQLQWLPISNDKVDQLFGMGYRADVY